MTAKLKILPFGLALALARLQPLPGADGVRPSPLRHGAPAPSARGRPA